MTTKLAVVYERLYESRGRDLPKPVFYYKGWRYYYPSFFEGKFDWQTGRRNEYNILTPTGEPRYIPWSVEILGAGMTFGDFKIWVILGSPPLHIDQCTSKCLHELLAKKMKTDNDKRLANQDNPGVSGEF